MQLLSCVYSIYFHDREVKAAKSKCYHLRLSKAAGYIRRLTTLIILWWARRTDSSWSTSHILMSKYSLARTHLSVSDVQHQIFLRGWVLLQQKVSLAPKATMPGRSPPLALCTYWKKSKSKIKTAICTHRLHWQLWSLPTVHKTLTNEHLNLKIKCFVFFFFLKE